MSAASRIFLYSGRFGKDYKRAEKRGKNIKKLQEIIEALRSNTPLPARCRPHKLNGNWAGHMECHIEPDWLLIYKITDETLFLAATGSHADLFKK